MEQLQQTDVLAAHMAEVTFPPDVLTFDKDMEATAEFLSQLALIVATCQINGRSVGVGELTIIALNQTWTHDQIRMARRVLRLNDCWQSQLEIDLPTDRPA